MERKEIWEKLQEIFVDVLDNDEIVLTADTTADDIDEWDSLTHIQLIVAIEKGFGIKLSSIEVRTLANVGEMAEIIATKISL